MLVYVLNKYGHPLMPTERCGAVRRMLKVGLAKIIKRCPFTVQLNYDTTNIVQEVTLGVDAGSKTISVVSRLFLKREKTDFQNLGIRFFDFGLTRKR